VQIYAYEVRLLGKETLRVGFRPVVAPDIQHPFLIDHNFGSLVEDNLQITTSTEGLLEYVGYRRDPKVIETATAVARAALSFAAPLPGPFKGDDGVPEFSRLVFKTNIAVPKCLRSTNTIQIAGRTFDVTFSPTIDNVGDISRNSEKQEAVLKPKAQVAGIHHRPLMPLNVAIVEQAGANEHRAKRREIMSVVLGGRDPALEKKSKDALTQDEATKKDWVLKFAPYKNSDQTVFTLSPLTPRERDGIAKEAQGATNPPPNKTVQPLEAAAVPDNLIGVDFIEAPIAISDMVYIPNPNEVDTFFLPKSWFAPQSYEINLAGGSIYDVKVRRKSEALAFVNGVTEFAGSFVRVPANIFTFTVVHEEKSGGGAFGSDNPGGSKDPGDYRKKQDKDPGDYRRKVDKD
jgi:hypothetical protein